MNFQNTVIKEMESKGYFVLKNIRLNKNGFPDLVCIKINEPDVWIECKEKNDTLKSLQKFRIDQLNLLGKIAYCLKDGNGIIYPL